MDNMSLQPNAAAAKSATSKRPAVDAMAPLGAGPRAPGGSDDDACPSVKRRRVTATAETAMPVVDAPAPMIPPSVPPSAPALQQLVRALGNEEPDLRDQVCILVCMPRYLAKCAADLPANPRGALGAFAVTVPTGTTAVAGDAFRDCAGLAQVTLPATVTVIEAGPAGEAIVGAFSGCSSLSEIALPPNLTKIG